MMHEYYNIGSGLLKHSGLLSGVTLERFILRKKTGFPSDIYFIETHPKEIRYISLITGSSPFLTGPKATTGMYDGFFDYLKIPFKQHYMHRTVRSLLLGKDIRETEYYRKLLKSMNKDEAVDRVGKLNRLMKILRKKGYKSQYEIGNMHKDRYVGLHKVPRHEIIVGMDRYGRLFRLAGGRHRLAVAQNIGLDKMSAVLSLIHKNAVNKLPRKSRLIRNYPEDFIPF